MYAAWSLITYYGLGNASNMRCGVRDLGFLSEGVTLLVGHCVNHHDSCEVLLLNEVPAMAKLLSVF
jgi:hypothetical protein